MIIQKERIISIDRYLRFLNETNSFYVCVKKCDDFVKLLKSKNICSALETGKRFVPNVVGASTFYNLHGKKIIKKNCPKEARTFEHDYHIVDWHGQDHYGTCFQTRKCYPFEVLLPPCEYMVFDEDVIRSDELHKDEKERIRHVINMFLEIFGMCEIVDTGHVPISAGNVRTVEWTILPPGKYPWEVARQHLAEYFNNVPDGKKYTIQRRHQVLADYTPDFVAIGEESFKGYVVYGYTCKDLYCFESNEPNNATYVFKGKWEEASKLTKREILSGSLCYKRLIHTETWEKNISALMNS